MAAADHDIPAGYALRRLGGGFYGLVGPAYLAEAGGRRRFGLRAEERHTNPDGPIHGGLLMTVMDMVLSATVDHALGGGIPFSTVSLNCDFLAPVKPGDWIEGEGEITRRTAALAFLRGRLSVAGSDIMTASGVWRVFAKTPAR